MLNIKLYIFLLSLSVGGNACAKGMSSVMDDVDAAKGRAYSAVDTGNDREDNNDLSIDTTPTSSASLDVVCTHHLLEKGYAISPID